MPKRKNQLPKSLTHVTLFSKVLAFLLFLAFIGVAFYAGFIYSRQYTVVMTSVTPTPTPPVTNR